MNQGKKIKLLPSLLQNEALSLGKIFNFIQYLLQNCQHNNVYSGSNQNCVDTPCSIIFSSFTM